MQHAVWSDPLCRWWMRDLLPEYAGPFFHNLGRGGLDCRRVPTAWHPSNDCDVRSVAAREKQLHTSNVFAAADASRRESAEIPVAAEILWSDVCGDFLWVFSADKVTRVFWIPDMTVVLEHPRSGVYHGVRRWISADASRVIVQDQRVSRIMLYETRGRNPLRFLSAYPVPMSGGDVFFSAGGALVISAAGPGVFPVVARFAKYIRCRGVCLDVSPSGEFASFHVTDCSCGSSVAVWHIDSCTRVAELPLFSPYDSPVGKWARGNESLFMPDAHTLCVGEPGAWTRYEASGTWSLLGVIAAQDGHILAEARDNWLGRRCLVRLTVDRACRVLRVTPLGVLRSMRRPLIETPWETNRTGTCFMDDDGTVVRALRSALA